MILHVYNNEYQRVGILDAESSEGLTYYDDKLTTSIPSGLYSLELKVPKNTPKNSVIRVGNMIEARTMHDKQLLLTISNIVENKHSKTVFAEDASINLLNGFVDAIEAPNAPEDLSYYVHHVLENTGWTLGIDESDESVKLEFDQPQRRLERLRELAGSFGVELDFETNFVAGEPPKMTIHFLRRRVEDADGFRISSDDLLLDVERNIDLYNVITKLIVRGKAYNDDQITDEKGDSLVNPIGQPQATQYDSSKSAGATSVSTAGWNESEVNQFRMDSADPPYVTGAYIDAFLRKYYSDSPLIGSGSIIKEYSDYFGISVGAFMGVVAKETTFGRGEPGKSHYNYGCIRWTSGSLFTSVTYAGSQWNNYPNQRTGIAAWFRLIRYEYVNKGQSKYVDFLNKYSPAFENDQATFKNIMWGVLKAFGYSMSATTVKENYSKPTDSVIDLEIPKSSTTNPTVQEPQKDTFVETAIKRAFEIKAMGRRYQWGGNGNPSWDCSGFMQECFKSAGKTIDHRWTTYTMWSQKGGHFRRISASELQRGDMIMYDTGYTYPGDVNHVGLYLGPTLSSDNSVIHAGDPVGITQKANSMKIIGYVRVVR